MSDEFTPAQRAWSALHWEPSFAPVAPSENMRDDGQWEVWDAECECICVVRGEPEARAIIAALEAYERSVWSKSGEQSAEWGAGWAFAIVGMAQAIRDTDDARKATCWANTGEHAAAIARAFDPDDPVGDDDVLVRGPPTARR